MSNIAYVDTALATATGLAERVEADFVIVAEPGEDPVSRLLRELPQDTPIDILEIYAHGGDGYFLLGGIRVDLDYLEAHAEALAALGRLFGPQGVLRIAGCDVAAGEAGRLFVDRLAAIAGVTVAASTDATGLGGDMELEYTAGDPAQSQTLELVEGAEAIGGTLAADDGRWGDVFAWPLIGVHAIVAPDGTVLTFGTDAAGMQGGQWIYDVWDPVTGVHVTLENTTQTNLFCGVAAIVPETGEILISGGDASTFGGYNLGINDTNVYDYVTRDLYATSLGDMAYQRWYPSIVTLGNGQLVILGGIDGRGDGVGMPEIYTPGDGWRELPGAYNIDLAQNWYYPRAWVMDDGRVLYLAADWSNSPVDMYVLDPAGDGSFTHLGTLPFATTYLMPSIRYSADEVLIMSAGGELWIMDISGETPSFSQVAPGVDLPVRMWSNMVIMADGKVLISGGEAVDSSVVLDGLVGEVNSVLVFDPQDNSISTGDAAAVARLYHSTTLLLADGTILSLGGGAPGPLNNLNGEIYSPDYLFDEDGTAATRPVIGDVPDTLLPGQTFSLTVSDAASISRLTFVRNGAVTHSTNLATQFTDLEFVVLDATTLAVTLPDNGNFLTPGTWMLFAFDADGTPSQATLADVGVTGEHHEGLPVVWAYSGEDFTGDAQALPVAIHEASKGELAQLGDNALSSLRIPEGYEVLLALEENPGPGDLFAFTGDVASLPGILADQVSWIQVRKINPLFTNDAPVAGDDRFYVASGASATIAPLANDRDHDGDALSLFEIEGEMMEPGWHLYLDLGYLTLNADYTIAFTPYYAFTGEVTFTYGVSDGVAASDHGQVTLVVGGPSGNKAPAPNHDVYLVHAGHQASLQLLANDVDPEGGPLTITAIAGQAVAPGGTVAISAGTLTLGADGSVAFQPTHGFTGSSAFSYTVTDNAGRTGSADVQLVVHTGLHNRPPSIQNDAFSTALDTPAIIDILANDADFEGMPLIVSEIDGQSVAAGGSVAVGHGTVTVGADYRLTFTPEADYWGPVAFAYKAIDPAGRHGLGTVTGEVTPPVPAAAPDTGAVTENSGAPATGNLFANDIAALQSSLTVAGIAVGATPVAVSGAFGVLTIAADGGWTYALDESNAAVDALDAGEMLQEVFQYALSNAAGASASTLTIAIAGANDVPAGAIDLVAAHGDEFSAFQSSTYSFRRSDWALDGEEDTFSLTQNGADEWFRLDFGGAYSVAQVRLTGRDAFAGRLDGAVVQLLDATGAVVHVFDAISGASPGEVFTFTPGAAIDAVAVRIDGVAGQHLQIAEIDVYGGEATGYVPPPPDFNLTDLHAPQFSASQSSTYSYRRADWALDGDSGTFSLTQNGADEWFRLDFGDTFEVSRITLAGRDAYAHRLDGAVVQLLDAGGGVVRTFEPVVGAEPGETFEFLLDSAAEAAAVLVRGAAGEHLQIAEIDVFGREAGPVAPPAENLTDLYASQMAISQSSTYSFRRADWALDGDAESFSLTQDGDDEWLRLDLGGLFSVSQVTVAGRVLHAHRLDGAVVQLLDAGGNIIHAFDAIDAPAPGEVFSFTLETPMDVAAILVDGAAGEYLQIAEIDVYGMLA